MFLQGIKRSSPVVYNTKPLVNEPLFYRGELENCYLRFFLAFLILLA